MLRCLGVKRARAVLLGQCYILSGYEGCVTDFVLLGQNYCMNAGVFSSIAPLRQPPALSELVCLYVGRCHSLWKDAGLMLWLEENVKNVLKRVDTHDPYVEECHNK